MGDISIYGQESNPNTWKLAHMNLAIRGIEADLGKHPADTFYQDLHPDLKADYVLANPTEAGIFETTSDIDSQPVNLTGIEDILKSTNSS